MTPLSPRGTKIFHDKLESLGHPR